MQRELKERDGVEKQLAAAKNELTAAQKELKERDDKISGGWHLNVPRALRPHSTAHASAACHGSGAKGGRGCAERREPSSLGELRGRVGIEQMHLKDIA